MSRGIGWRSELGCLPIRERLFALWFGVYGLVYGIGSWGGAWVGAGEVDIPLEQPVSIVKHLSILSRI